MLYGLGNVALQASEVRKENRGGQYAAGPLYGLAGSGLGLKDIIHVSNGVVALLHRKLDSWAAVASSHNCGPP